MKYIYNYYNNFKAEIANKSLQSEDESVKKTCSNLCYLVDRIRYDNKKNSFHVGKNEFAFLSCIADNRMDNELKKKGEDFFLENLNNFRQTKFRTEIIKKRKGLSCRKKKYSIQKPLEPLKVDDLSTQE